MAADEVYDFNSVGVQTNDPRFSRVADSKPIGIKTPLGLDSSRGGPFRMHFNVYDQIKDNLKNLILTNSGDRLGRQSFGGNLLELCTEFTSKESFDSEAMIRIKTAVAKSMPYVELSTFESEVKSLPRDPAKPDGMALVSVKISYSIPRLRSSNNALEFILYIMG